MEKLIELFKDYIENYGNDTKDPTIDYAVIYDGQGFYVGARFYSDEKILSKKFGWIKWLVENDKIDRDKELKENGLFRKYFYILEYVKNYDRLVMWLSVEDEPINFLISILK